MFLPDNLGSQQKEAEERKKAYRQIETWGMELIPENFRANVLISVQEIACGDPQCAPIDTSVTIQFQGGCDGMFGLPMEAKAVSKEDLQASFPTTDILEKWYKGVDADWPPIDVGMPKLRFEVGQKVFCRIGPDANKDWAPGTVMLLWYREQNWPQGSFAPYKIKLDDGRDIFAPADMDQVIRKQS